MPWWGWLIAGIMGVVLLGVVVFFGFRWTWHGASRRYLVQLIGRSENIIASRRTLEAVMGNLAEESAESLMEFAEDPESVDRKALLELTQGMAIVADELWTMPLPKRLWPVGEALGDAAATIGEESGRIHDLMESDEVLAALGEVNLSKVAEEHDRAQELVHEVCAYYDVEDAAVYGGGLYI